MLPSFDGVPDLCGIVDVGAYKLSNVPSPTNTTTTQQHAADAVKAVFHTLGQQYSIMITLMALWDSYTGFFLLFRETRDNMSQQGSTHSCNIHDR